jgi:hypothetical protein
MKLTKAMRDTLAGCLESWTGGRSVVLGSPRVIKALKAEGLVEDDIWRSADRALLTAKGRAAIESLLPGKEK